MIITKDKFFLSLSQGKISAAYLTVLQHECFVRKGDILYPSTSVLSVEGMDMLEAFKIYSIYEDVKIVQEGTKFILEYKEFRSESEILYTAFSLLLKLLSEKDSI